jgi:hypothetical protein
MSSVAIGFLVLEQIKSTIVIESRNGLCCRHHSDTGASTRARSAELTGAKHESEKKVLTGVQG